MTLLGRLPGRGELVLAGTGIVMIALAIAQITQCPWCETPFDTGYQYCPRCGRQLGAIRLYQELLDRGIEDREARAMLVRAGYEPF